MTVPTQAAPAVAFPPVPRQREAPPVERLEPVEAGKTPVWWGDEREDEGDDEEVEYPRESEPRGPVWTNGRASKRDAGMATAEYAVATLAAAGFAGVLLAVVRSGEVQQMLMTIIRKALTLE